jgi:hypothetical protein
MSYATHQCAKVGNPLGQALRRRRLLEACRRVRRRRHEGAALAAAVLLHGLCACVQESDSVLPGEDRSLTGSAGTGSTVTPGNGGSGQVPSTGNGSAPSAGGSALVPGSGGSGAAQGGTENTGNGGALAWAGSPGSMDPATGCQARTSVTIGTRATFPLTWPATLGTTGGTGNFELLNVYRLTVRDGGLTGTVSPCGSALPPFTFSGLIGGGNCRIEIPDSVWETPGFPQFDSSGTLAGWEPGSRLDLPASGALVGLTMADPTAAWPDSYTGIDASDPDGDGNPGITAVPATGDGLASPPVSIIGPRTDQVHLVSRTAGGLSGTFTSCTELSGEATLQFFDNHVVGCRTVNGDLCNATQTDFVDTNRTIYTAAPGTFRGVILPEGATCSDARAALP